MIRSRLIGLIIFILVFPIIIIIGIIIIIDDGRPIFFFQKRIGLDKKEFLIIKFRTMIVGTPNVPTHLMRDNSKIYTKTGELFRKYSLDELPQIFNIIKGDILFIGPRPALYNQSDLIGMRDKKGINKIKPGITGWAQINGRDNLSLKQKVELDYYYLENQSIVLDLKILLLTLLRVIRAKDVQI